MDNMQENQVQNEPQKMNTEPKIQQPSAAKPPVGTGPVGKMPQAQQQPQQKVPQAPKQPGSKGTPLTSTDIKRKKKLEELAKEEAELEKDTYKNAPKTYKDRNEYLQSLYKKSVGLEKQRDKLMNTSEESPYRKKLKDSQSAEEEWKSIMEANEKKSKALKKQFDKIGKIGVSESDDLNLNKANKANAQYLIDRLDKSEGRLPKDFIAIAKNTINNLGENETISDPISYIKNLYDGYNRIYSALSSKTLRKYEGNGFSLEEELNPKQQYLTPGEIAKLLLKSIYGE